MNKIMKFHITNDAEKNFKIAEGHYMSPAKDFILEIEGEDWSFAFHNEPNNHKLEGSVEIYCGDNTVGYADVFVGPNGDVKITGLDANGNYYWPKGIKSQMAGFIKRGCHDAAIIACMRQIEKSKYRKNNKKFYGVTKPERICVN